jgi:hypothetical protein
MKRKVGREGWWELVACLVVVLIAVVAYFAYDPYALMRLVCTPDCP